MSRSIRIFVALTNDMLSNLRETRVEETVDGRQTLGCQQHFNFHRKFYESVKDFQFKYLTIICYKG